MNEFFKFLVRFSQGRKRKVGLVTLLMACLFMVGWVRSFFYCEGVSLPFLTRTASHSVWSNQDGLSWVKELSLDNPDHWKDNQTFRWGSLPQTEESVLDAFGTTRNNWFGFEVFDITYRHVNFRSNPNGDRVRMIVWIVPYWSIVLPLTLLSAYLLRSTPSPLTWENITQPIQVEGPAS